MKKIRFTLADPEKWNAGRSLHKRAKSEERKWRKGLAKKKAKKKSVSEFHKEWVLVELTGSGALFLSRDFKGVYPNTTECADVPF